MVTAAGIGTATAAGAVTSGTADAQRVNHTTLPSLFELGSVPQLSLSAATIARPRPEVASGSKGRPRRGGLRSLSATETVSRPRLKTISTEQRLSGWAWWWTLASNSVIPIRVASMSGWRFQYLSF